MTALCRDCGTISGPSAGPAARAARRCAACGSPRVLAHEELTALPIAHIDCDAFYASVEKRDDPRLRDRPVIVGGGKRGVVLTACYIARQSGVRSAMPMFKALKLCPDAAIVKPSMAKYAAEGRRVRALMLATTPQVEPVSIDEAYLDLSGTERLHRASPAETLARLARQIESEIGITVSIGLSFHRTLAKIASGFDKPRGFTVIGRADAVARLDPLAVRELPGIGPKAEQALTKAGIATIAALRRSPARDRLAAGASEILAQIEAGVSGRPISPGRQAKSISAETTFADDLSTYEQLSERLWPLCERVSARLKEASLAAVTIQLTVKTADFRRLGRQCTVDPPTQLASVLFETGAALLRDMADGRPYRLIGIGVAGFAEASEADQDDLLNRGRVRKANLERAVDAVRAKLGPKSIGTGRGFRPAKS